MPDPLETAGLRGNGVLSVAVIVAAYAALYFVYIRLERANEGKGRSLAAATGCKLAMSALFCWVGAIGYMATLASAGVHSEYYYGSRLLTLLGLCCCVPGDYFLQYIRIDNMRYRIGIAFFLCAQALFLAGSCLLSLLGGWWLTIILTLGVLIAVMILMKRQNWVLGEENAILTLYTFFLALTTMRAIVSFIEASYVSSLLMALGMAFFLASDMVLGIWNYHSGRRFLQNVNWALYFTGTMLIALSVNPAFDVLLV